MLTPSGFESTNRCVRSAARSRNEGEETLEDAFSRACRSRVALGRPDCARDRQTSLAVGGFEAKQWVAANSVTTSKYRDHVYAMWAIFDDQGIKLREAVSPDRGLTCSRPVTITSPSDTGPPNFGVHPSVDAAGNLQIACTAHGAQPGGCARSPVRVEFVTRAAAAAASRTRSQTTIVPPAAATLTGPWMLLKFGVVRLPPTASGEADTHHG